MRIFDSRNNLIAMVIRNKTNKFSKTFYSEQEDELQVGKFKLKKNEEMLAKIVFDKMGHAQNLKIIKWADNDLTQSKFLSALKNIRQIQNPPKGLIKNNETFTVFYGLKIKI